MNMAGAWWPEWLFCFLAQVQDSIYLLAENNGQGMLSVKFILDPVHSNDRIYSSPKITLFADQEGSQCTLNTLTTKDFNIEENGN